MVDDDTCISVILTWEPCFVKFVQRAFRDTWQLFSFQIPHLGDSAPMRSPGAVAV